MFVVFFTTYDIGLIFRNDFSNLLSSFSISISFYELIWEGEGMS